MKKEKTKWYIKSKRVREKGERTITFLSPSLTQLKEQTEKEKALKTEYDDLSEEYRSLKEELSTTQQACLQWHTEYKEQLEQVKTIITATPILTNDSQTKALTESLNDQSSFTFSRKVKFRTVYELL